MGALGRALKACRWLQIESVVQCLVHGPPSLCECVSFRLGPVLVSGGRRARSHEMWPQLRFVSCISASPHPCQAMWMWCSGATRSSAPPARAAAKKATPKRWSVGGWGGAGWTMAPMASMAKALCLSGPSDRKHFDHVVAKPRRFAPNTHTLCFSGSTQQRKWSLIS